MNPEERFDIRDGVMFNRVGEELVLLDLDQGTYLGLDSVGSRFWELLGEGASIGEATDTMLTEYEVSREELERDLEELLADLKKHKLLTVRA
jgi:hypothetical protein